MRPEHWIYTLPLRLRSLFRRQRIDQELEEELRYHVEEKIEGYLAKGLDLTEARRRALLDMDGIERSKEECREARKVRWLYDVIQDLQYAVRLLRKSPGFTAVAVLTLALGIGANTAVFTALNTLLLKPLPYHDPERIVALTDFQEGQNRATALSKQVSIPDFQDWQSQSSSFEAMTYCSSREAAVMLGPMAEYARVTSVSPDFFRVFGVEPIIGRSFRAEETKTMSEGAVIISYAVWQSHFGGDPKVLGQTAKVYGLRHIVGVLPPGFHFPNKTDLWVPAIGRGLRSAQNYRAFARLKPGVFPEEAQTEMTVIASRLEAQYPETNKGRSVAVTRLQDEVVGDFRLTLYLLMGAVSVVLLIGCANTATLLLGRGAKRAHEVAVRAALGASRQRLVRQFLTESVLLAMLAGGAGLLLASWASRVLVALAPADVPLLAEADINQSVLAFTMGISMVTSLLFGLVPALSVSSVDLKEAMKQGPARLLGGRMIHMRGAFVVAEIALATVLLSAAGLLIKSFVALDNVALGFRPENVLVMRATVPAPPTIGITRARRYFAEILSHTATLPGVLAAGATMAPPGNVDSTGRYFIDRLPAQPDWPQAPSVVFSVVAPGTFGALGIPLKRGRDFSEGDTSDRPFVAIVNEALVRNSFPNQDPLGRTIFCPFDSLKGMTIIGVVGDVRQRGPEREPMPECYMPYGQHAFNETTLSVVVRTSGDPQKVAETLRQLAQTNSPDVPMKFTTMEATLSENVATPRFRTLLFAAFAGLALVLSMAGVYSVLACAVGQRTKEIGLRMALGASRASVVRLVLGQGLAFTGLGLALGLAAAAASARLLKSMLFHVQPNDPGVYLAVVILLSMVALFASYIPARRASTIEPLIAIRQE